MLLQVQVGLDQGGAIPSEYVEYELMQHMHWTEDQLKAASRYMRMCIWDFIQVKRARGLG